MGLGRVRFVNSVERCASKELLDVVISPAMKREIRKWVRGWSFDWLQEFDQYDVYKLQVPRVGDSIQGLISILVEVDHVRVTLLESHPSNVGRSKEYDGVPGCLLGYVAMISNSQGFEGAFCLDVKSTLFDYYEREYGAIRLGASQRMVVTESRGQALIAKYEKDLRWD